METLTKIIISIVALVASAIVSFVLALIWMWCWNYLVPVLGLPILTYWQSFAICILLSIVGSFFKDISVKGPTNGY